MAELRGLSSAALSLLEGW